MTKKKLTNKESEQAAKALQALFASEYVNKKKLYTQNFIRGISFGAGSFLGATIGDEEDISGAIDFGYQFFSLYYWGEFNMDWLSEYICDVDCSFMP